MRLEMETVETCMAKKMLLGEARTMIIRTRGPSRWKWEEIQSR